MKIGSIISTFLALTALQVLGQTAPPVKDSVQVLAMVNEVRASLMAGKRELGLKQAKQTAIEAKRLGNKALIMESHFYLGTAYNELDVQDSAIHYYTKTLREIKSTFISHKWNKKWFYYTVNNLIYRYEHQGMYNELLDQCFEAVDYFEEIKDTLFLGRMYSHTGNSYDNIGEYEKSIQWQRRAKTLFQQKQSWKDIELANTRIGIAYDELGQFDSAHFYNQKALQHAIQEKDTTSIIVNSSNIGNTYLKEKKWEQAKQYLETTTRLKNQLVAKEKLAISYSNLGKAYLHVGEYSNSRAALKEALSNAKLTKEVKYESEVYDNLHQLFKKTGAYDSALFYYQQYKLLQDSIYGLAKTKEVLALSTKYETSQKERQIERQNATLAQREAKLASNQKTIIFLILLSLFIILLSVLLYKRYKTRKESEYQAGIIAEQEKGIQAVFEAQEEERKRISKDLHDGVGQQLSGIKMAFHRIAKNIPDQDAKQQKEMDELAQVIADSAEEVRSISHQMMPRALTELGLISAIQGMLEKSLKLAGIQFEFEQFGIKERLPENIEIGLYRVCQELVNNIIKHSGANNVNVQLIKNSSSIILLVEDDGSGISSAEKTSGHGLLNMRSRVNTLNGEINLEPSPTSGTLATIRIPV